ncbi:hypothetical protein [Streptomyces viridochromogenes]|uniref:hypothetical protein n=1 Tax=Streptomyces viridochromogenes TaxID=1938 RepID=UPI0031D3ECB6
MHEQTCELVDRAPGAGNVAGDGRGNPVAVLGHALSTLAMNDPPAAIELAVTAGRVTTGEVSEKDQISSSARELGEPLPLGLAACGCLWLG